MRNKDMSREEAFDLVERNKMITKQAFKVLADIIGFMGEERDVIEQLAKETETDEGVTDETQDTFKELELKWRMLTRKLDAMSNILEASKEFYRK